MDQLKIIVQNISVEVRASLIKKIKTQDKKLQLFRIIEQDEHTSNRWMNEALGYPEDNYTNLYTLKNRLFDDIIESMVEMTKNNVIVTKEKVQSLRFLAYSKHKLSLLRELKRHERKALKFELFNELKEIYFCFFLTFRNNPKQAKKYSTLIDEYEQKQRDMFMLEKTFYSDISEAQDLFYRMNENVFEHAQRSLDLVSRIHAELQTKSSEFFYLIGKLTLTLTHKSAINDQVAIQRDLENLTKLSDTAIISHKYPDCILTIRSLHSKFYFLTGQRSDFYRAQKAIRQELSKVEGYQLFDGHYFYYVYVSLIHSIQVGDQESNAHLLREMLPDVDEDIPDNNTRAYVLYLHAILALLEHRHKECTRHVTESRKYFADIGAAAGWMVVDILLINLIALLMLGDSEALEIEIQQLNRKLKHWSVGKDQAYQARAFFKEAKLYLRTNNHGRMLTFLQNLQRKLEVLRTVHLDEDLFNRQHLKSLNPINITR